MVSKESFRKEKIKGSPKDGRASTLLEKERTKESRKEMERKDNRKEKGVGSVARLVKDCWSKVQKIEENQQASASSAASTANSSSSTNSLTSASAYNANKQVKMVRIEEIEEEGLTRQFDLTGLDSEDESFGIVRVIRLIEEPEKEDEDEEFHDCFMVERQLSDSIPDDVQWVSMDIEDVDRC